MLCNTGLVYVWELEWLEGNISVREERGRIGWRRPEFALAIKGNYPQGVGYSRRAGIEKMINLNSRFK